VLRSAVQGFGRAWLASILLEQLGQLPTAFAVSGHLGVATAQCLRAGTQAGVYGRDVDVGRPLTAPDWY
jgi:hypothetical protein